MLSLPHERSFILVFWQKEWLGEGNPFYLKLWAKLTLLERKRRLSIDIRSYRLCSNTYRKNQLSLIRSPRRAFQWAQDDHHTLPHAHFRLKNAKWPFSVRKCTSREESLLQLSLREYCRRQSCKAFTGLSIHSGATSPTTWKFGWNWHTPSKTPISHQ